MPEMQQRSSLVSNITAAATVTSPATRPSEEGDIDPHAPQSIPPWVHINTSDDDQHLLLPTARGHTVPNSRHYRPEHPPPPSHYRAGRKWDHLRSPSPPFLSRPIAERQAEWKPFVYSGPNPQEQQRNARVVSKQWMDENMPALAQGWREEDDMAVDGSGLPSPGYGFKGLMYKGKWLVSPARQEKTVRIFWVRHVSTSSHGHAFSIPLADLEPLEIATEESIHTLGLPLDCPGLLCGRRINRSNHL